MKLGKTKPPTEKTKSKPLKRIAKAAASGIAKAVAAVKKVKEKTKRPVVAEAPKAAAQKSRSLSKPPPKAAKKSAIPKPVEKPAPDVMAKKAAPAIAETQAASIAPIVHRPSVPGPVPPRPRPMRTPREVPVAIPKILLEPDHLPAEEPAVAGREAKFAPAPLVEAAPIEMQPIGLPESYGTEQIFLAARDPYWLLASWDLDDRQRKKYGATSASGGLIVRLRKENADGPIHFEAHSEAGARDSFIHAGAPGTTFVAELGFFELESGAWRRISVSRPVVTPRDRAAEVAPRIEERFEPATELPVTLPAPREEIVFAEQRETPRISEWQLDAPVVLQKAEAPRWTEQQAKALEVLYSLESKQKQMGSLEIEELLRQAIFGAGEQKAAPSSLEFAGVSELLGLARAEAPSSLEAAPVAEKRKGFWFKVNAELVIYGSTEPDAHVSIGGRPIRLRADGSFSYRFALPDGQYELPVIALSREGDDGRVAELEFARGTRYGGEVGAHAQDASLKTPAVANL